MPPPILNFDGPNPRLLSDTQSSPDSATSDDTTISLMSKLSISSNTGYCFHCLYNDHRIERCPKVIMIKDKFSF